MHLPIVKWDMLQQFPGLCLQLLLCLQFLYLGQVESGLITETRRGNDEYQKRENKEKSIQVNIF